MSYRLLQSGPTLSRFPTRNQPNNDSTRLPSAPGVPSGKIRNNFQIQPCFVNFHGRRNENRCCFFRSLIKLSPLIIAVTYPLSGPMKELTPINLAPTIVGSRLPKPTN